MNNAELSKQIALIENLPTSEYEDVYVGYARIEELIRKNHPEANPALWDAIVSFIKKDRCITYNFMIAANILMKVSKTIPVKDILEKTRQFRKKERHIRERIISGLLQSRPGNARQIFDILIKEIGSIKAKEMPECKNNILTAIAASKPEDKKIMFDVLNAKALNNAAFLPIFSGSLNKLAADNPELAGEIAEVLSDRSIKAALDHNPAALYATLENVIKADGNTKNSFSELFGYGLMSDCNTPDSLNYAYSVLEKVICRYPDMKEECFRLTKIGLASPHNDDKSTKKAYLILGNWERLKSGISIGERVDKSPNNKFGWQTTDTIATDKVTVLILGGNGSQDDRAANGYAKSVQRLLTKEKLVDEIKTYSVVYNFGNFSESLLTKMGLFIKHNRKLPEKYQRFNNAINSEENINPKYVNDLFKAAMLPRISAKDGQERLTAEEAVRRMGNLKIIAHCHGATVALMLEEKSLEAMAELGYSQKERELIQKQLLVLAHAPNCPLGVAKSQFISLCSAQDYRVQHYNFFDSYMRDLKSHIPVSFFAGRKGNIFAVHNIWNADDDNDNDEHTYYGYEIDDSMTPEGKVMTFLGRNILINSIKHSLKPGKLGTIPSVQELAGLNTENGRKTFDEMVASGEKIYAEMILTARQLRSKQSR